MGKPNCGKSTFFSAATLVDAEIANYPFTTVKANQGTSYVKAKCPHPEKGEKCDPVNSKCMKGERLVPIRLIDVAGLVKDAHLGKGLGNQFMNDLMQASALIHVVDASGGTDEEGKPVEKLSHDPAEDVKFLEKELSHWIKGVLTKNWEKISKQASHEEKGPSGVLAEQLSGLGIKEEEIKSVLKEAGLSSKPADWGEEEVLNFSELIRKKSKPILIAANKVDVEGTQENVEKLREAFPENIVIPCSAESELALRKAEKSGAIEYIPGGKEFSILKGDLPEKQRHALEFISKVMEKNSGTGVQEAINKTAFELLDLIVVYPVQDSHKWASGKGHRLPDAYLLKNGSTALDLAFKIHGDFGKRFLGAVDCRSQQKIGKDHELKDRDVVKIILSP